MAMNQPPDPYRSDFVVPPRHGSTRTPTFRTPQGRFFGAAGRFIFEVAKVVLVALAIIIPIRVFVIQPFQVNGQSMAPNFSDRDYLVVDEISYRFREPERGEVIIFRFPRDRSQFFIKRIIGMPGETVRIKEEGVFIVRNGNEVQLDESFYLSNLLDNGPVQEVVLAENEYFMLGDNRGASSDSRSWGPITRDDIIGRAWIRAWPFNSTKSIPIPTYNITFQPSFNVLSLHARQT
jgi:signal peptidase I